MGRFGPLSNDPPRQSSRGFLFPPGIRRTCQGRFFEFPVQISPKDPPPPQGKMFPADVFLPCCSFLTLFFQDTPTPLAALCHARTLFFHVIAFFIHITTTVPSDAHPPPTPSQLFRCIRSAFRLSIVSLLADRPFFRECRALKCCAGSPPRVFPLISPIEPTLFFDETHSSKGPLVFSPRAPSPAHTAPRRFSADQAYGQIAFLRRCF